jgi:hypothetical protein
MAKLSIRCAPAGLGAGTNLGMNTVDLAAHSILKEHGLLNQVELTRPWGVYNSKAKGYNEKIELTDRWPMRFNHPAELVELKPAENVLFWGDFQHGWDYQQQSSQRLLSLIKNKGQESTFEECYNWCLKYFMLEGDPYLGAGSRVGAYGGTLFQNRLSDYQDSRYISQLEKLYKSAAFIRVRDPYSAWKVNCIRNEFDKQFLAPDAAMLNKVEEISLLDQACPKELSQFDGAIGLYFGRSTKNFPWLGASLFINKLRSNLGAPAVWVPWDRHSGGLFASHHFTLSWMSPGIKKITPSIEMTPGDTLNSLRRLQLVITDTYHLAINCLIQGIPAICIHEPSPHCSRNANIGYRESARDKRSLLYMTHDLVELLVPSTDLSSCKFRNHRADVITSLVKSKVEFQSSFNSLRNYSAHHRTVISDYIKKSIAQS